MEPPLGATAGRQARLNTEKPPCAAASGHQVKAAKVEASRLLPGSAEVECGREENATLLVSRGRGLSLLPRLVWLVTSAQVTADGTLRPVET